MEKEKKKTTTTIYRNVMMPKKFPPLLFIYIESFHFLT